MRKKNNSGQNYIYNKDIKYKMKLYINILKL